MMAVCTAYLILAVGRATAPLSSARYPHATILGIDSSAEMIESARKLHPDCDFEVLDAGSLDSLGSDFDVVFSNACLQWVPDHEHVLPSLLHRLRSGGVAAAQFTENHQPAVAYHHARGGA